MRGYLFWTSAYNPALRSFVASVALARTTRNPFSCLSGFFDLLPSLWRFLFLNIFWHCLYSAVLFNSSLWLSTTVYGTQWKSESINVLFFFNESLSIIKIYLLRKYFYLLKKKTSLFSVLWLYHNLLNSHSLWIDFQVCLPPHSPDLPLLVNLHWWSSPALCTYLLICWDEFQYVKLLSERLCTCKLLLQNCPPERLYQLYSPLVML